MNTSHSYYLQTLDIDSWIYRDRVAEKQYLFFADGALNKVELLCLFQSDDNHLGKRDVFLEQLLKAFALDNKSQVLVSQANAKQELDSNKTPVTSLALQQCLEHSRPMTLIFGEALQKSLMKDDAMRFILAGKKHIHFAPSLKTLLSEPSYKKEFYHGLSVVFSAPL